MGRNIAYNLSKMNIMTEFITPLGGDESSNILKKDRNRFFSMDHSMTFLDEATSTYLVILDEKGEVVVSVNDMKIMEIDHAPGTDLGAQLIELLLRDRAHVLGAPGRGDGGRAGGHEDGGGKRQQDLVHIRALAGKDFWL